MYAEKGHPEKLGLPESTQLSEAELKRKYIILFYCHISILFHIARKNAHLMVLYMYNHFLQLMLSWTENDPDDKILEKIF
jgi:hypothetical protein